jgi:hypothetical protein
MQQLLYLLMAGFINPFSKYTQFNYKKNVSPLFGGYKFYLALLAEFENFLSRNLLSFDSSQLQSFKEMYPYALLVVIGNGNGFHQNNSNL